MAAMPAWKPTAYTHSGPDEGRPYREKGKR